MGLLALTVLLSTRVARIVLMTITTVVSPSITLLSYLALHVSLYLHVSFLYIIFKVFFTKPGFLLKSSHFQTNLEITTFTLKKQIQFFNSIF